jgi:phosphotransferase system enzyme I (PtsI)
MDNSNKNKEQVYKGISISSGAALAKVCLYSTESGNKPSRFPKSIEKDQVNSTLKQYIKANEDSKKELIHLAKETEKSIGKSEAAIFYAQSEILSDPVIINLIESNIKDNFFSAIYSVSLIYDDYEKKFKDIGDEYFSQRSNDISDIKHLLHTKLIDTSAGFKCEGLNHCSMGKDKIIVAKSFSTEMMINVDLDKVKGIITQQGGINSHAAIIARSVGLPAIFGVKNILDDVKCGTKLLLDAESGNVYLNPSNSTINRIISENDEINEPRNLSLKSPKGIKVFANTSIIEDVLMG